MIELLVSIRYTAPEDSWSESLTSPSSCKFQYAAPNVPFKTATDTAYFKTCLFTPRNPAPCAFGA